VVKGKNLVNITQRYILRRLPNADVIVPLTKSPENLVYVDATGVTFWKYLKKFKDVDLTITELSKLYGVDKSIIETDILKFIENIENPIKQETKASTILPNNSVIPIKGSIELTGRCNLRCKHCYAVGERIKPQLDTNTLKKIFRDMKKEGCLFLQLTGGECMHRKDFGELYKYIRKLGIVPTISTNATMLDDTVLNILKKYPPQYIRVSLYGSNAKIHEDITQIAGSFDRVISSVKKMKDVGLEVYFSGVLFKGNQDNILGMKELAKSLDTPIFFYNQMIPTLDASVSPLDMAADPKLNISKYNDIVRKFITIEPKEYKIGNTFNCNAGKSSFHIDCTGNMYICKVERTKGCSLVKDSFSSCWKKLNSWREELLAYPEQCLSCSVVEKCRNCPVKVSLATKANVPYWFCSYSKGGDIDDIL